MSSTSTFMVVALIHADADMAELSSLIPAEIAQVERLREAGRMGQVHIALARRTVFIEVHATDEIAAIETVDTLPLAKFFTIDVYPTMPPGMPERAQ